MNTVDSEERYKGLISNLNAGVIVHAPDTSIILANDRASEILGLTKDQMEGKMAMDEHWQFIDNNKNPIPLDDFPISKILRTLKPIKDEIVGIILDANGTKRWAMVNGIPIFNADGQLQEVIISFVDITALRATQSELKKSLEEKTILLKEVHHRIKNNIINIESLLMLQIADSSNDETIRILTDTIGRVQSMRVLYELLTGADDSTKKADVSLYLKKLTKTIMELFPDKGNVSLKLKIEPIILSSELLFSLGIVINELMTNSMKYAFNALPNGEISLELYMLNGSVRMIYKDNGPGMNADIKNENSTGLGFMLINMLCKHFGARLESNNDHGAEIKLDFNLT